MLSLFNVPSLWCSIAAVLPPCSAAPSLQPYWAGDYSWYVAIFGGGPSGPPLEMFGQLCSFKDPARVGPHWADTVTPALGTISGLRNATFRDWKHLGQ